VAKPQRSKRRKSLAERAEQKELTAEMRADVEAKMCGQKKRFEFRGDAQRLADEYGLGVYKCPVCSGWHFTSKTF
jgi:DNA-directed RNA polymerase subunit M/transcription elongation factor TFIIS